MKRRIQSVKILNCQPRISYPANLSYSFKREIKTFFRQTKLRKFNVTKSTLQETLKGGFQVEMKKHCDIKTYK